MTTSAISVPVRQSPTLPPIAHVAREVARSCKRRATELDEAFLKGADLRAIQGGAICEEAQMWRDLANEAYRLCGRIQDMEE